MASFIKKKVKSASDRLTIVISAPVDPGWEIDLYRLKRYLQNQVDEALEVGRPDLVSVAFTLKEVGLSTLNPAGALVQILEHSDASKLYYNGTKVVSSRESKKDPDEDEEWDDEDEEED